MSSPVTFGDDDAVPQRGFALGQGAVIWPVSAALARLEAARGQLFVFVPVLMGIGTGGYFALTFEPDFTALMGLTVASLVLFILWWRGPLAWRLVALIPALICIGFVLAAWRAHSVSAPVIYGRYYGPIEGRIIAIDRSSSDALRITLDHVHLNRVRPDETPLKVRLSLHGEGVDFPLIAGTYVATTGHLSPPSGPVEPGGFSFQRMAWFHQLGAVGYTRNPVLAMEAAQLGLTHSLGLAITRFRYRLSTGLQARIPGQAGGFVAAILTGDRSGVSQATTEALRQANLSHLLAISGLHMGLLTGVVYGGLRAFLALFPLLALYLPIRKIAALGALIAASFYLAMSGGNIATQRAFVMAAVMLCAVLLDRRAVSMRSVALAAVVLLIWRPEAIVSAGFQMSFAATIALVAVFRALSDWRRVQRQKKGGYYVPSLRRKLLQGAVSVILCSVVAGLATAPISAFHFHRFAEYGFAANLVTVPLMGLLIMPAAVATALLWVVGVEQLGLCLMELGVRWILFIADRVAQIDDALRWVISPAAWVLPVLALSALWLALWQGRARFAGAAGMVAALGGWAMSERPVLLVEASGALMGVMTEQGRTLSRPRGAGFVAQNWLEADGDGVAQADAAARDSLTPIEGGVRAQIAGIDWLHLSGVRGERALSEQCRAGRIVVINRAIEGGEAMPCTLYDLPALRQSGALAVSAGGQVITSAQVSGTRLWTRFAEP